MRHIRNMHGMSDDQLDRLNVLERQVHEVQDMQELFMTSIGEWSISILPDPWRGNPVITPLQGIQRAFETWDSCQSEIDKLWKHRARIEREGLSSAPSNIAVPEEQRTADSASQEETSIISQEEASSTLQEDTSVQPDPITLAEFDQSFALEDRDAGRVFVDDQSDNGSSGTGLSSTLYSEYGAGDPEDVEWLGEEGAILLAERPFRRLLERNSESMTAASMGLLMDFPVKEELEKCITTFCGLSFVQRSLYE